MRDYQRSKVYDCFHSLDKANKLKISKLEVEQLIVKVLNDYNHQKTYAISHAYEYRTCYFAGKKRKTTISSAGECFHGKGGIINICPDNRIVPNVLHEITHLLLPTEAHRPKFVGLLIDIYSYYMQIDEIWLEGLCGRYGVNFDYTNLPQRIKNSRKYRYAA